MDAERVSFLALHAIPGVGNLLAKQLIGYCGSAQEVFKKPKGKLEKIPGIGSATAHSIVHKKTFEWAIKELERTERDKTELIFYTDQQYPHRLKSILDAPALLYYKGSNSLNPGRTVGIVGTRRATSYGKKIVEKIIDELVPYHPTIISGLAYGIDIHAHRQALKKDLPTIGILGSGINIIYPGAHHDVAMKMIQSGGILTENYYDSKPDPHHFPSRNRIIAGLSDVLIVVEAAVKGGALITADIANSYHKDVFAVPGPIGETYCEGCNKLIKEHKAGIYTDISDITEAMRWTTEEDHAPGTASIPIDWTTLSEEEKLIIEILQEKRAPVMLDELIIRTALSPGVTASTLLGLEFKNMVKALPGKRYEKI